MKFTISGKAKEVMHLNKIEEKELFHLLDTSRYMPVSKNVEQGRSHLLVYIKSLDAFFIVAYDMSTKKIVGILRRGDESVFLFEKQRAKEMAITAKLVGVESFSGSDARKIHFRIILKYPRNKKHDWTVCLERILHLSSVTDMSQLGSDKFVQEFISDTVSVHISKGAYILCVLVKVGKSAVSAPFDFDWL